MIILWGISAISIYKSHGTTRYTLKSNSVAISKKKLFGTETEVKYPYNTILSIRATSHKHGAYGNIVMTTSHNDEVVLRGIANPRHFMDQIQPHISKRA